MVAVTGTKMNWISLENTASTERTPGFKAEPFYQDTNSRRHMSCMHLAFEVGVERGQTALIRQVQRGQLGDKYPKFVREVSRNPWSPPTLFATPILTKQSMQPLYGGRICLRIILQMSYNCIRNYLFGSYSWYSFWQAFRGLRALRVEKAENQ